MIDEERGYWKGFFHGALVVFGAVLLNLLCVVLKVIDNLALWGDLFQ